MLESMEISSIATQKWLKIYAVKDNWHLDQSIQSKISAMAFSTADEIKRELIAKRTTEALRTKKAGGIPLGLYRPFIKSLRKKRANYIDILEKNISFPSTKLGTQDQIIKESLITAGLAEEKLSFVPFKSIEIQDNNLLKDIIAAKVAIAEWLGLPLGRLQPEQLAENNTIVATIREKRTAIARVKQLFELWFISLLLKKHPWVSTA